mmetsp:Transcript_6636/g.12130  ORF Transcript_6636/g.12130 Transcript_6636/m.12130 type:complete len:101 (+) Transcript_6636:182-484(+)
MYCRLVSLPTLFDDDKCALIRLVNSLPCRLGNHKSISTCRLEHNRIRIGHLLIDEKGKEFKLSCAECSHMSMDSATSFATQKEHVAVLCASFSWQKLAPS